MPEPTKAISVVEEVTKSLTAMQGQFKMALPSHVTPEKFIRVAITAIRQNPKLLECDKQSLYGAFMNCATDGLLADGREAAIVPYGPKARYMPMVGGICKKARNSGEIKSINAAVVCEKDTYRAWTDEKGEHFNHEKARDDRGGPILTYAYAITKDGGFYFEEIDEVQMAAIQKMSKASDSPWKGPFADEMRRKSAIRRLAKYRLPASTDLENIIRQDDDIYDAPKEEPAPGKTTSSRLSKIVETTMTQAPEEVAAHEEQVPI